MRALWEFAGERVELEPWKEGEPVVPVEVEKKPEVVEAPSPPRANVQP
jgi:hypothetical protein